ncbi:MAG: response regulator transcription factor [Candidatus Obscuribacterales bacterium]|nr:response regulator transcription factor [Candidatus Obscuribacterales bacterium]
MSKILIIEDDERISRPLAEDLTHQKYLVEAAYDGETGWKMATETTFDLIVLDWMLPKMDGITVCEKLREYGYAGSILMLTAKDTKRDKIRGLDCGADDYIIKPFELEEFSARVRAMLRRNSESKRATLAIGNLMLDPSLCLVTYAGEKVSLTPTEYRLLNLFLRNPKRVFSKDDLLERLWTSQDRDANELVKAHIKGLRNNLKASGITTEIIETVHGLGYRLSQSHN